MTLPPPRPYLPLPLLKGSEEPDQDGRLDYLDDQGHGGDVGGGFVCSKELPWT